MDIPLSAYRTKLWELMLPSTGVCSVLTKVALYSVLFSDSPITRLASTL
ncbi:Uncharacterised protein [Segatella copri]|nr:Uncharacterised protein [Segatella copri]